MQPVGLYDPLEIAAMRNDRMRQAAVHDPVVKTEIDGAIGRYSHSHGGIDAAPFFLHAQPNQQDGRQGKNGCIEVIPFHHPPAGAMVAGVKEPSRPMHDPAVHGVGKPFHPNDCDNENADEGEPRHIPTIPAQQRHVKR